MPTINWIAVVVAALANMVLGAVWYGAFGETWLQCIHKRKDEINPNDPVPYLVAAVGSFFNAAALAYLLAFAQVNSLPYGVVTGTAAGMCFVVGSAAKHYAFSQWPAKLFAIDCGVDLIGFALMSFILMLMGVKS